MINSTALIRHVACLLAAVLLTGGIAATAASHTGKEHEPPAEAAAGEAGLEERLGGRIPLDLPFRDETGRTVQLRELVTGPTIIAPVYYGCPNVCSFLQGGLARALPEVRLRPGEDYRVLSISFDETETPETAKKNKQIYYDAMGGRFPQDGWRFLTGDPKSIRALLDAAGYRFQRRGGDFLHPVAVFVVTGDGEIVRYLHGTRFLPMDLTLALVEAAQGRIGPTIRKMAEFCFSYDPQSRRYVFNLLRVSATVILATAGGFLAFLILRGRKKPSRRGTHDGN